MTYEFMTVQQRIKLLCDKNHKFIAILCLLVPWIPDFSSHLRVWRAESDISTFRQHHNLSKLFAFVVLLLIYIVYECRFIAARPRFLFLFMSRANSISFRVIFQLQNSLLHCLALFAGYLQAFIAYHRYLKMRRQRGSASSERFRSLFK